MIIRQRNLISNQLHVRRKKRMPNNCNRWISFCQRVVSYLAKVLMKISVWQIGRINSLKGTIFLRKRGLSIVHRAMIFVTIVEIKIKHKANFIIVECFSLRSIKSLSCWVRETRKPHITNYINRQSTSSRGNLWESLKLIEKRITLQVKAYLIPSMRRVIRT